MTPMRIAGWGLVIAVAITVRPPTTRACAPAPMPGTYVSVTDEEAVIVWDAARRVQHFVRRASFEGTSGSFGFLVPTPTQPELAEADDRVFARLWQHTVPRIEHRRRWVPHTCCTMACGMFVMGSARETAADGAAPPVTVLDSTRVAGMDATVLAATDATALAAWLSRHGFERSPALEGWLAQYVRLGWILTAFRYTKSGETTTVAGRAARMSFRTERPFFPYREPEPPPRDPSVWHPPRVLRVYLVGATRLDGTVGDAAAPWGAQTEYSRPLGYAAWLLRGVVPDGAVSSSSWLTRAIDVRAVRPTDADLFFAPSADRSEIAPVHYVDDEVIVPIPVELIVPVAIVVWLLVRRRRRRKRAV